MTQRLYYRANYGLLEVTPLAVYVPRKGDPCVHCRARVVTNDNPVGPRPGDTVNDRAGKFGVLTPNGKFSTVDTHVVDRMLRGTHAPQA